MLDDMAERIRTGEMGDLLNKMKDGIESLEAGNIKIPELNNMYEELLDVKDAVLRISGLKDKGNERYKELKIKIKNGLTVIQNRSKKINMTLNVDNPREKNTGSTSTGIFSGLLKKKADFAKTSNTGG
jgi:hypothetical protein